MRWCVQGIDVFTPNVVEFDNGVPDRGRRGGVRWKKAPLHPCHCKQVPLGAPLHNHIYRKQNRLQGGQSTQSVLGEASRPHTFETTRDESGREVVVVVHEADVSGGEAHSQQWFLAVH